MRPAPRPGTGESARARASCGRGRARLPSGSAQFLPRSDPALPDCWRKPSDGQARGLWLGSSCAAKRGVVKGRVPYPENGPRTMPESGPDRRGKWPAESPQIGLIRKGFSLRCAHPKRGITACGRLIGAIAMRGKRCAGLRLLLLPAALLGAGAASAETAPPPAAIVVLDASSSMNAKIGSTSKIAAVRTELGQALGSYAGRLSFGLVAFGHRKASNCADSEILAKPGELTFASQSKLLDKIKPKGQAPIAAALSDAAKAAQTQGRFDIVLIADGGDTCDADICSTAVALKEKSQSLRIHVIGFNDKPDELKPLTCVAGATGGTFVAATNAAELKQGLATVLDAIVTPGAPPPQVVAAEETAAMPAMAPALPAGVATAQPIDLDAAPDRAAPPVAPVPAEAAPAQ